MGKLPSIADFTAAWFLLSWVSPQYLLSLSGSASIFALSTCLELTRPTDRVMTPQKSLYWLPLRTARALSCQSGSLQLLGFYRLFRPLPSLHQSSEPRFFYRRVHHDSDCHKPQTSPRFKGKVDPSINIKVFLTWSNICTRREASEVSTVGLERPSLEMDLEAPRLSL